jgi:hypothetical protein
MEEGGGDEREGRRGEGALTSTQSRMSALLTNEMPYFDEQDENCLLVTSSRPFASA